MLPLSMAERWFCCTSFNGKSYFIEAIRCFDDSYIDLNNSEIIIQSFPVYEVKEGKKVKQPSKV